MIKSAEIQLPYPLGHGGGGGGGRPNHGLNRFIISMNERSGGYTYIRGMYM